MTNTRCARDARLRQEMHCISSTGKRLSLKQRSALVIRRESHRITVETPAITRRPPTYIPSLSYNRP